MSEPAWVRHAIWWHVYPLGAVGAFPVAPGAVPPGPDEHRLLRLVPWLDHAVRLGASGVQLGPVLASATHGYDTTDHLHVDPRLGTDADLDAFFAEARSRGLRVLLDGVFNHVAPTHPLARRALAAGPGTPDGAWLRWRTRPDGTPEPDTFEGHDGLVALDHANPAVADLVVDVMTHWLDRGASGWRLDAAYAVPTAFWAQVLPRVRAVHPDAYVVGEVIHGDYAGVVAATGGPGAGMDAVTQYELWKAVWSSLEERNFFELAWSLRRHETFTETFVPWTFVGNHDVTRLASRVTDARHHAHAAVLLATLPGTPAVYAGDEWGATGVKEDRAGGDDAVRPDLGADGPGALADLAAPRGALALRTHQVLLGLRRRHPWLHDAHVAALHVANAHLVLELRARVAGTPDGTAGAGDAEGPASPGGSLVVALNLADGPLDVGALDAVRERVGVASPLVTDDATRGGEGGALVVAPHGWAVWA